jgi:hypothetical protein
MPSPTPLLGCQCFAELLGAAAMPQAHPQQLLILMDQLLGAE